VAQGETGADIGVIGGSGFYDFLDDAEQVDVPTPYGSPSDALTVGTVGGRRVAFVPRHGRDHRFPPHRIPYRANLWALRALGVRQVLAPCAVGGLQPHLGPGALVVPDQLVDRTSGRVQTFHEEGAVHVPFADPYCPVGRRVVTRLAGEAGWPLTPRGTMVVIEGPRFSTRAESQSYGRAGWDVVNMTGHPEAVLARELALCFTAVALVTDLDAGVDAQGAVTAQDVFRVFADNVGRLRTLLTDVVGQLPGDRDCPCGAALDGLDVRLRLP
jgi:5'-methylthioadenosine phosphorylase